MIIVTLFNQEWYPPQKAVFIIKLDGCHCLGEVRHNSLEQSVMNCQTDKHLKLVILAQSAAGRLNLGDQLGVHPPQLGGPGHCAGSAAWGHLLRRACWTVTGTAT